jgi:hypothetical protein
MKDLFEINVECHAGYKAGEYPKQFFWNEMLFEIEEILDRWYQGDVNPEFLKANYFKVRTSKQKIYILKHETETGRWFLWIKGESMNL